MSKKKNKSVNTPSAKAARNLEALKKAKEIAVKAESAKVEEVVPEVIEPANSAPSVEQPKPVGKKEDEKTEPTKPNVTPTGTPTGKTAYETHVKCRKSPFMSPISRSIYKDDNGIEQIRETWKNTNSNDTVTLVFPVSHIKEDDNMYTKEDLNKLRGNEPEPVAPKVEKPKAKKKDKVETPEVIEDAEIVSTAPTVQIPSKQPTAEDRIDANRSVDLMSALMKRRAEIKDKPELAQLYEASGKQADVMLWTLLTKWNTQWKDDAEALGIRVNNEMFAYLQNSVSSLLGVKLIGAENDGQMTIDFESTIKQASPQIQTALKQEAAAVKKEEKIPTAEECVDDAQKVTALRTIMAARRNGKGTMGTNLMNAIEFARKAFKLSDKLDPGRVLAVMLQKFAEQKQESILLNCMSTAVLGNLKSNLIPVAPHSWLKGQIPSLNDTQIAELVMVFLSKKLNDDATTEKKNFKDIAAGFTKFLHAPTDDLINRLVDSAKVNGKNDAQLTLPTIKGVATSSSFISSLKVVNAFKAVYGSEQGDKLIKTKMKQILAAYNKLTINPLSVYVEKGY